MDQLTMADVLSLAKAGFSADDIKTLSLQSAQPAQPVQPAEAPAQSAEVPAQPTEAAAKPNESKNITISESDLQKLLQGIAVSTASGKVELPPGIDDTLGAHYQALMKGEI